MNEIKTSLEGFNKHLMEKLKASEDTSAEALTALGTELNKRMDDQIKKMEERKLSLPGLEETLKTETFHLSKCIRAQVDGQELDHKSIDGAFEKEVLEEAAKLRSNNAQTGEAGGFLVPDEVTSEIIELAMAKTPVMEMNPTVIRGLRGELPIPKVTGRPQMYWVGEEEEANQTQTKFGEIVLRPKTAAAFTKVSKRLLHQTSGTAEAVIREELVKAFKLGLDTAFLFGSGTSKVPKGIANFDDLTPTGVDLGVNGNRFRIDDAAEMAMNIDVANMLRGNLGYVMRPEVLSFMLRERVLQFSAQDENTAQPINSNSVLMSHAEIEAILGYKVRTSTLIPLTTLGTSTLKSSEVLFGDWSQFVIGMWEGFEIRASDTAGNASGSALTQRQVWITAFQGVDTNMKDESGFTKAPGALVDPTLFT